MSLRHAILVLLQDQEASGYDLAREFANSIGLVWNATHQQIYLELGKLNDQNMVKFRHILVNVCIPSRHWPGNWMNRVATRICSPT